MKKKTLDKFMSTRLDIKNTKSKKIRLPTGEEVVIPKLSYRHFQKIKELQDNPEKIMGYVIDTIKPREVNAAETEFMLIHLYAHNKKEYKEALDHIGINLDDLKITEAKYDFVFDNIRIVFNKPTMLEQRLPFLIKEAYVDGKPQELTEEFRFEVLNQLYRFEFEAVKLGVIQEVYIVHEGKTIKGLNIIGD